MIGIDTNLLVRFLINDDPKQALFAAKLIRTHSVFVSKTVLLETEWVLRYSYDLKPPVIHDAFTKLMGLSTLTVEDSLCVTKAMAWYLQNMDFADALHLASAQYTDAFATLDKALLKTAKKLQIKMITFAEEVNHLSFL